MLAPTEDDKPTVRHRQHDLNQQQTLVTMPQRGMRDGDMLEVSRIICDWAFIIVLAVSEYLSDFKAGDTSELP
jgi:hypothetical protein